MNGVSTTWEFGHRNTHGQSERVKTKVEIEVTLLQAKEYQ